VLAVVAVLLAQENRSEDESEASETDEEPVEVVVD